MNHCCNSCLKESSAVYTKLNFFTTNIGAVWRCGEWRYAFWRCCKADTELPLPAVFFCVWLQVLLVCALTKKAEKPNSGRIEGSGILLAWVDSYICPCWLCLHPSHSIACVTSHVKVPSWSRTSRGHTRSRRWGSQIHGIEEECMPVT